MIEIGFEARRALGLSYVLDLLSPGTPYGRERVRNLRFFTPKEAKAIEREWRNVGAAVKGLSYHRAAYDKLGRVFQTIRDIRKTLGRLPLHPLSEVELFEIKRFLLQLSQIAALISEIGGGFEGIIITEEGDALSLLDPEGRRAAGFSVGGAAIHAIREEKRRVEHSLREAMGKEHDRLSGERARLVAQEEAESLAVRAALSEALRAHVDALLRNVEMIGSLDFIIQKAELAKARGAVMPALSQALRFDGMENPEIADMLSKRGRTFTRVSVELSVGATVITGANMGGKSVALRTLVLNALLCQAGFFAFASRAELPLFDEAHLGISDAQDSGAELSSFGGEVVRIGATLRALDAGAFCLVALDEPARGTNPEEGAALVRALVRRLSEARAVSVVATHYDGVAREAQAHYQAAGLSGLPEKLPEGDRAAIIAGYMNYGLIRVNQHAAPPREALAVCRLLRLDGVVLRDMESFLREGE